MLRSERLDAIEHELRQPRVVLDPRAINRLERPMGIRSFRGRATWRTTRTTSLATLARDVALPDGYSDELDDDRPPNPMAEHPAPG